MISFGLAAGGSRGGSSTPEIFGRHMVKTQSPVISHEKCSLNDFSRKLPKSVSLFPVNKHFGDRSELPARSCRAWDELLRVRIASASAWGSRRIRPQPVSPRLYARLVLVTMPCRASPRRQRQCNSAAVCRLAQVPRIATSTRTLLRPLTCEYVCWAASSGTNRPLRQS